MGMRGFFMVAIMLSTLLCYCESEEQLIELSRDELLEIEDQLERLNKSSIKTIKTYYGDIYDCIDFYEQPAFDHPLLKNRKYDFQMKPSSHMAPMVREDKPPKNVRQVSINSGLKGEKCPTGFVPIRRTTKEDLIRAKLFTKSYTSRINSPPTSHHALVYTSDSTKKYNGGGTIASFYTLYNVTDSQYTFGRIKLQNGLDIIQAGWGVNPSVYGDNKTRIFIYFQAGELSCFNTVCPGFVLVDPQPMIDRILRETHPGTFPTWEIGIYIYRTQHGDICDCINFYEQPAFDHPLLKNHKYDFRMGPSSHPNPMVREDKPPKNVKQVSINSGLKGEKCPIGFIPIRRSTKEDLIRAKLFTKSYASRINSPPAFHHALVYTSHPTKKCNGGIFVNPSVYGDNKTRIFIYFQAGELSCFITVCPVFVLVDPQPMIQMTVRETHPGNLPTWELPINMYRDPTTRNWWFQLGENYDHIGYWPSSIFSGRRNLQSTWSNWSSNGVWLTFKQDTCYDAYCRALTIINEAHIREDAKNTKISSIDIDFYLVKDWGFRRDFRHLRTYGALVLDDLFTLMANNYFFAKLKTSLNTNKTTRSKLQQGCNLPERKKVRNMAINRLRGNPMSHLITGTRNPNNIPKLKANSEKKITLKEEKPTSNSGLLNIQQQQ
ncbi:hypothetical protein F8388_023827 [Cannabis sativa]|uniref:Neprosin PEP catalytic domain-containing protein n=1 Tax=Cannabis sativa TaxID=3483 RepID=A0A7J6GC78_CANSA|nr:hypothetical protein F8388_023827 [Cannabis sativa]